MVYKQVNIEKLMIILKVVVTMIYDSCKNVASSKSFVVYIFTTDIVYINVIGLAVRLKSYCLRNVTVLVCNQFNCNLLS